MHEVRGGSVPLHGGDADGKPQEAQGIWQLRLQAKFDSDR